MVTRPGRRGAALLPRLGIRPFIGDALRAAIEDTLAEAERRTVGPVSALDAGCGRRSPLRHHRPRIGRLVGVDIHPPRTEAAELDEFAVVDLCGNGAALPDASFDIVLSNFTMEHFHDPAAAIRNFHRWLRPGGSLIITTVNRRHPFVRTYLAAPERVRGTLQPWIKSGPEDAHPLVGACNDAGRIRGTLEDAGLEEIRIRTLPNLAHAWRRRVPAFLLGIIGDVLTRPFPARRSTFLVTARKAA